MPRLRNIRMNAISKKRVRNYFLYAIGEIILVVIGILIALQVNEWNEGRRLKKLEISYYENLLVDLQKDSVEYVSKWKNANYNQHKLQNILNFIENDYKIDSASIQPTEWRRNLVFTDTSALMLSLSQAGFVQFPKIFENTITDLRSTGNIKLLSNDSLKNEIIIYYNKEKIFEDWNASYLPTRTQVDMTVNKILPLAARIGYTNPDDEEFKKSLQNGKKYDEFLKNIQNSPELKTEIKGMYHIQARITMQCEQRDKDRKELAQAIEAELERLKKT